MDYTEDGKEITIGLRVFTYDMRWGTVVAEPKSYIPHWWRVRYDNGDEQDFNGARMTVRPSHNLENRYPDK